MGRTMNEQADYKSPADGGGQPVAAPPFDETRWTKRRPDYDGLAEFRTNCLGPKPRPDWPLPGKDCAWSGVSQGSIPSNTFINRPDSGMGSDQLPFCGECPVRVIGDAGAESPLMPGLSTGCSLYFVSLPRLLAIWGMRPNGGVQPVLGLFWPVGLGGLW